MEKTTSPFDNIHLRDPWSPFMEKLITVESFITDRGRRRESLNGPWHYTPDPCNHGLRNGWHYFSTSDSVYDAYLPYFGMLGLDEKTFTREDARRMDLPSMARQFVPLDFDFEEWPVMDLPCCWNMTGDKYFLYEGTMYFTRLFTHSLVEGERAFLHVGGANYRCAVFVGGHYFGTHRGGGGGFCVELTSYLTAGTNRIIMVVDNTRRGDQLPMDNHDWFNYGGIHRDIEIIYTPGVFIRNFYLGIIPGKSDTVRCEVEISDTVDGAASVEINGLIDEAEIPVRGGRGAADLALSPELWSPDHPRLYDVTAGFLDDRVTDRVGFRDICTRGDRILLNGKDIYLKGISVHEESVTNGRSLTEDEIRENLMLVKELGGNFLRLAHYPHSAATSRLADELGVLLWEEIPVYWAIDFENPDTLNDAKNQLAELIVRDRNRASVIIWSVGNENEDTPRRYVFMKNLVTTARELDATRLISAACLVNWEEHSVADTLSEALDVVGINEYLGWYLPGIEKLPLLFEKGRFLNKPFIISETGAGALAGRHGGDNEFFTEEKQRRVYEEQIGKIREIDNIRGMTPWILYDFRTPLRTNSFQRGYNRKGLLSEDKKTRKQAFHVLKEFYESIG